MQPVIQNMEKIIKTIFKGRHRYHIFQRFIIHASTGGGGRAESRLVSQA
jgi:hypothetical protein